jgi:CBS domain-containing protein
MAPRPFSRLHRPTPLHQLRGQRSRRLLAQRAVAESIISMAGLVGAPVHNSASLEVGRVVDVVARWEGAAYPPVTGLVVKVGRRPIFVAADLVATLTARRVDLRSARLDLRDFVRRPGEVALAADVVDHQLIDVEGVRVVRAADLYLARALGALRLVGVDVGFQTLLRRLGPAWMRARPRPDRVIDWASIQPFGTADGLVRMRRPNQALHRLRPGELADLLEELGRTERQELLDSLEPAAAADALEEMDADELAVLLREATPERGAVLLAGMEPDEAADALRDLDEHHRERLLVAMPADAATRLRRLLRYPAGTAGGLMTSHLILVRADALVAQVREQLRADEHRADVDAVIVVDDSGRMLDDVSVFELFLAEPTQHLGALLAPPWPVTVAPDADLEAVVEAFTESRGSSLLVVDSHGVPIGRILADDLVDALAEPRRFTRTGLRT